jgi:hypothetical protein
MLVDLTPADLSLKLYAGDQTAVVVHALDRVTKQPVDLSDRTWAAQWRRKRTSSTAVNLSVDDSGAASGELIVYFPGDLEPIGTWDLEGTHAVTGKDTILTGEVLVFADVTRLP